MAGRWFHGREQQHSPIQMPDSPIFCVIRVRSYKTIQLHPLSPANKRIKYLITYNI